MNKAFIKEHAWKVIATTSCLAIYGPLVIALAPAVMTEKFWAWPEAGISLPECNISTGQVCR